MNGYWLLLNVLFSCTNMIRWFPHVSLLTLDYINWFANVKLTSNTWNKSYLTIVSGVFFNTFWTQFGNIFVEDFCIDIHGRHWPVVLLFFNCFYCCLSTVVSIHPNLPDPSHPQLPPLIPHPLDFVHGSFIVVPENPSSFSPHYPLPLPLWLLSVCS